MTNTHVQSVSCGGEELRIVRLDGSLTPYSKDHFLEYYGPDGWRIWQNAVPYKDAAGNRLHVLVRIGERSRWGCVGRISQESVVLESMLDGCDDDAFLDLSAIVGCDLCYNIGARILDYLCGYDSDWWEQSPCMGALDVADKLGLERLLSSIVRPLLKEEWERCSIGHCTPAGLDTIPAQLISGAGDELRIERSDGSLTPYSKGDFLEYYGPDGWRIWQNAVPYKDAAGNRLHVLVRIGQRIRWGSVVRISQESVVLESMLEGCDDDAFLDLSAIVGCDLCYNIGARILDYLCGYDSDWWEQSPCMGALDVADKLGLERLLSSIVRPLLKEEWERCSIGHCTPAGLDTIPAQPISGAGDELRIERSDGSLTPYSKGDFLKYYGPDGWIIWQNAVPYKDAAGNRLHVLVRIGQRIRWGCVVRISQESAVLKSLLEGCDDDAFLDLRAILGCDLCDNICVRILDYLCGSDSDWWEQSPSMGALDVADKLGLERLLYSIVRPLRQDKWKGTRNAVKQAQCVASISHN